MYRHIKSRLLCEKPAFLSSNGQKIAVVTILEVEAHSPSLSECVCVLKALINLSMAFHCLIKS